VLNKTCVLDIDVGGLKQINASHQVRFLFASDTLDGSSSSSAH
jgi:hypothetical protein